jgi:effector-binding domain-containing protein
MVQREVLMSDYEVTAKQVDPVRVAILRDTIESYAKVGRMFKELHQALEAQGIAPVGPQLAIYFDEDYKPRDVDVAVAAPVGGDATLPEDGRATISDLPGGTMVSLLRQGPWDDFRPAYRAIMAWVEANGYQIAGPNREIHVQGPGSGVPPEQFLMEIQFPITKR